MTWTSCAVSSGVKRSSAGRRLCRALLADGYSPEELRCAAPARSVLGGHGEVPQPQGGARAGHSADAPFVVDPDGRKIPKTP